MIHSHASRSGSVFLVALAVVLVMVVIAYSLLAVARDAYVSARANNLRTLAQHAARLGTLHACGELDRDFLNTPNLPTSLRARWRAGFWPIDTYHTGKDAAATATTYPYGAEYSPEDLNDNDTKVENLLTELYCRVGLDSANHGGYFERGAIFQNGVIMHPGGGRYIEAGRFNRDLVGKPVSFDLDHPTAFAPDIDAPLWLDGDLHAAASAATARYRLRYAVAIEDLSGHLALTPQGAWTPGLAGATAGMCSDLDAQRSTETDLPVAGAYADAFANLAWMSGGDLYPWWAWLGMQGFGAKPVPSGSTAGSADQYTALRAFSGGFPQVAVDHPSGPPPPGEPDQRQNAMQPAGGTLYLAQRGPFASFEAAANPNLGNATINVAAYLFTPFQRCGVPVSTPTRWYHAYTATPWRVNLPTASPLALGLMLAAYLPAEYRSLRIASEVEQVQGANGSWSNVAPTVTQTLTPNLRVVAPAIDLFSPPAAQAAAFTTAAAALGASAYPGTAPGTGAPWREDLGKDIDVNTFADTSSTLRGYAPLWGQTRSYYQRMDGGGSSAIDATHRWAWVAPATLYPAASQGYWYGDSYWLDVASAFVNAVGAAQFAWLGENGKSWDGSPAAGQTRWPASWSDPECAALAGMPTIDSDRDGDGTADAPSWLATVAQVDRQFLKNLGEWPEDEAAGARPSTPHVGLYLAKPTPTSGVKATATLVAKTPSNNLKSLLAAGTIIPAESALMELVVNDMRMSFFGASPQYPDFRPIDLDDDGRACCSCYPGGWAAADAATSRGPAPPDGSRFSLTGYLMFQKSRYYRVFVRGEVYDCLRQLPVASADQETVYHLDPAGACFGLNDEPLASPLPALRSEVLFQRWLFNRYQGYQVRGER